MTPQVILLIEDDAACSEILSTLTLYIWNDVTLVKMGTLEESLHFLERFTPDMVITDLYIPPTSQEEVCDNPRSTIDSLIKILPVETPIIAISGYLTPLEGQEMLAIGADAFITKGVRAEVIQRKLLSSWLRNQGHRRRYAAHEGGRAQSLPQSPPDA